MGRQNDKIKYENMKHTIFNKLIILIVDQSYSQPSLISLYYK